MWRWTWNVGDTARVTGTLLAFPLHGVSYISGDDSAITQKRTLIPIPLNCNLSSYHSLEHVC